MQKTNERPRCANCKRNSNGDRLRAGRCMSCYRYYRNHGVERPPERRRRSPKAGRPLCARCRQAFAGPHSTEYCEACYQYKRLRGRERPRYLWAESCFVCKRPRSDDRRDGYTKGRCPTCYSYRFKHGVDRTPDMVAALAPLGWCDCRQPATGYAVFRYLSGEGAERCDRMPVCDVCAAEFA